MLLHALVSYQSVDSTLTGRITGYRGEPLAAAAAAANGGIMKGTALPLAYTCYEIHRDKHCIEYVIILLGYSMRVEWGARMVPQDQRPG